MSVQVSLEDRRAGASVQQCVRLLRTIRGIARGPVRVTVDSSIQESENPCLMLLLEEQVPAGGGDQMIWHVWSFKRFYDNGYLISYGALFDLLIVGYTRMAREYGDPEA